MNRKLDNGMFVVDVGYRNDIPVALVERQYNNTVEYIIAFNYEIENNKMRLAQGRIHLSKYFSSVDVYDQFAEAYIEEMKDDCNVLYTTKYLIKGNK